MHRQIPYFSNQQSVDQKAQKEIAILLDQLVKVSNGSM
jgi:hypothetical protein